MDEKYFLCNENIILLSVNVNEKYFSKIFSKLEFLTAFSYIYKKTLALKIPIFSIDLLNSSNGESIHSSFLKEKIDSIMFREANPSSAEDRFNSDFRNLIEVSGLSKITSNNPNNFFQKLKRSKRKVVFITGFMTEFNIVSATLRILDMGGIPVVISDGVSTSRERMHFAALEILSNFSHVLDSRDLIREWDGAGK